MNNDTIFALSTILGKSGVAVIRVSGNDSLNALKFLNVDRDIIPNKVYFESIYTLTEPKELIDKCIVIYFKAPYSFTGEDIVEFQTHGSVAVIKQLLFELSKIKNSRIAEPGEFSKRAFLNNKFDLTQAEGLVELIEAETNIQKKIALRQISGELKNLYENWRSEIISILALLEAFIDFPDDDLPLSAIESINSQVEKLLKSIEKHLNDGHKGEILMRGIRVAIVGEPNVGKSSLFNKLAKRDVAIVSSIAGTTRDVLEIKMDLEGYPFIIYDTAGIRDTEDIIEKEGVKRAILTQQNADIVILMTDIYNYATIKINIEPEGFEEKIIVINKIDLLDDEHSALINEMEFSQNIIRSSVTNDIGVETILKKLIEYAHTKFNVLTSEPLITQTRYRQKLELCKFHLKNFQKNENNLELFAEDVRLAASSLGSITGKIDVEEILDNIFSTFCIGK